MNQVRRKVMIQKTFYRFLIISPKYNITIILVDFNAKVGKENVSKPTIGNESLHRDSNNSDVRIVNFATTKNLVFKTTMFPHRNIHKYTWTSPDGKTTRLITY